ncbi:hypothetical protein [Komagataeibacter saccharivorans]|uniref:hypothetical protein n=1 Tax=Komagataeibacter saccharivorans TaxID=265959 RepID=UPI002155943F|nr:hypothetical protein [Komagataeibacter saccharivorans]
MGAIVEGIGSTILPWSGRKPHCRARKSASIRCATHVIQEYVSLCIPEIIPETEASVAVLELLIDLAKTMLRPGTGRHAGIDMRG